MAERDIKENVHNDGTYVVRKNRKERRANAGWKTSLLKLSEKYILLRWLC